MTKASTIIRNLSSISLLTLAGGTLSTDSGAGNPWLFEEVATTIGANWNHGLMFGPLDTRDFWTGGLAAADIDQDGFIDLYVTRGDQFPGRLFRNLGNGQFEEVSAQWELIVSTGNREASYASGAAFADVDGNGFPDLFLPGVREFGLRLYLNDGTRFTAADASWGLSGSLEDHLSLSFADVNNDGRLDAAVTHWDNMQAQGGIGHLWMNQGSHFSAQGDTWGVSQAFSTGDYSFTPNFADFNGDMLPDLVISSDFNTSQTYLNVGHTHFSNTTNELVITDENGMGSAVGDYDNDGDLDWFVTSIYDTEVNPSWGTSGNRLYRNDGAGVFTDVTESAGVREGFWGWGACMQDFNNDGLLDIYHVNGWNPVQSPFQSDPARLYINQGNGQFIDTALEQQAGDTGQGRGIVCFDYDRDGDVDVFINNNQGLGRVYRNNASSSLPHHWLGIRLQMPGDNHQAIGAKIIVSSGGQTQHREMRIPNHYLSTSPPEVFIGLNNTAIIDEIQVQWPDGASSRFTEVDSDQWIVLPHPSLDEVYKNGFE